jgi:hypothetical protein
LSRYPLGFAAYIPNTLKKPAMKSSVKTAQKAGENLISNKFIGYSVSQQKIARKFYAIQKYFKGGKGYFGNRKTGTG